MNLFNVFTETKMEGTDSIYVESVGEYQFYWRGEETDSNTVWKKLESLGHDVTFVERLK